jgi:hypothetical protein
VRHQRYFSKPACRKESKTLSQRRWLQSPENQNYFPRAGLAAALERGVKVGRPAKLSRRQQDEVIRPKATRVAPLLTFQALRIIKIGPMQ